MPILKNQRWEIFCQGILKGMTGDAAYTNAGYKPNVKNAARLKCNEVVKARIAELKGIVARGVIGNVVLTRQWVIEALLENAEKALGRRPVRIGPVGPNGELPPESYVREPIAANQAVRMAGLELGMFTERRDVNVINQFANLTEAQLAQRLVDVGRKMLEGPQTIEHDSEEEE